MVPGGAAGFTKATVSAWRVSREDRLVDSSSIIISMSAIRKLAAEAADNGLLAPELAAGISRVKSAKTQGIRVGNWLSLRQAQALLSAPDTTTLRGLRDRAILAVLLGLWPASLRSGRADVHSSPATRWPLVHR
jgi:site-specific recombinase XerD